MIPNVDTLRELVEWAEAEEAKAKPAERRWDQGVWIEISGLVLADFDSEIEYIHELTSEQLCNSSYCIAGKAVVDAGYRKFFSQPYSNESSHVVTENGPRSIEDLGFELLGINPEELYEHPARGTLCHGNDLFETNQRASDIRIIAEAIAGKEL